MTDPARATSVARAGSFVVYAPGGSSCTVLATTYRFDNTSYLGITLLGQAGVDFSFEWTALRGLDIHLLEGSIRPHLTSSVSALLGNGLRDATTGDH